MRNFYSQSCFWQAVLLFQHRMTRGTVVPLIQRSCMLLATEIFQFDPDITGISCSGRFTLGTRLSETEAMLQNMLDEGVRKLVLDLTHVDFVDSAGLGIIMRIYGEMTDRGGQFRISGPHEQVRRLFDITRTSGILAVDDDLVTSVKKLQESSAASSA